MWDAMIKIGAASVAISLCFGLPALADEAGDVQAAKTALKATFDKPDNPLSVEPVVVSGDYGIADWSQGKMGGRALLRRKGDTWVIALCSGDALRSAATLRKIGLPQKAADAPAGKLAEAEKHVDAPRLAQLASFEGTVPMDTGPLSAKAAGESE